MNIKRLREMREKNNLTQNDIAKILDIDRASSG